MKDRTTQPKPNRAAAAAISRPASLSRREQQILWT
jgi:hypothetical protein